MKPFGFYNATNEGHKSLYKAEWRRKGEEKSMTHEQYMKKLTDHIAFEKQYLKTCIDENRECEIAYYCERLARHIKEHEMLKQIERGE